MLARPWDFCAIRMQPQPQPEGVKVCTVGHVGQYEHGFAAAVLDRQGKRNRPGMNQFQGTRMARSLASVGGHHRPLTVLFDNQLTYAAAGRVVTKLQ